LIGKYRIGWRGALTALSLIFTSNVWAGEAHVVRLSGTVEERLQGQLTWQAMVRGDKISEGTNLRTGADSELELVTDRGHHLQVKSNTRITLTSIQDEKTVSLLEEGRVVSDVRHLKKQEQFSIQTPTAVCAVRGTQFETAVHNTGTWVTVYRGVVGLTALAGGHEMAIPAGHMAGIRDGTMELPRPISLAGTSRADSPLARAARHEVGLDMSRNQVMAAAALEQRTADYREGKSLIDVNGNRVRLEEYIVRSQPNEFKLVVLNERSTGLDYFFYAGTFNQNLPADLSVALKDLGGTFGTTAPTYYLTSYEMGQSNTVDSIHDTATGGHLVNIQLSNGNYVLTDNANPGNTRVIAAAQLQSDGTYKIYNPLADSFSVVSASQKDSATQFGLYIPENDTFKDLSSGNTIWETRFNSYTHALDNVAKITYTQSGVNNILATGLDATYTYAGGFVIPVVTVDPNKIDETITNYYGDGTFETYRTTLIDDLGQRAPNTAFAGVATGAAYNNELLKWNYEQQVTASEFAGRQLDLVVEPKIFIESGLIQ
jgi:hypothetical protein